MHTHMGTDVEAAGSRGSGRPGRVCLTDRHALVRTVRTYSIHCGDDDDSIGVCRSRGAQFDLSVAPPAIRRCVVGSQAIERSIYISMYSTE